MKEKLSGEKKTDKKRIIYQLLVNILHNLIIKRKENLS
jgi:hypothetical protein